MRALKAHFSPNKYSPERWESYTNKSSTRENVISPPLTVTRKSRFIFSVGIDQIKKYKEADCNLCFER